MGLIFSKILAKMGKDLIFCVLFMIKMIEQDEMMILSISSRMGVGWNFEKIALKSSLESMHVFGKYFRVHAKILKHLRR